MKQVVCALIVRDNRILVTQRGPGSGHAGMWEFPGGKIQAGETPPEALQREVMEELCIAVDIVEPLRPVYHQYPARELLLQPFLCRWIETETIVLTEHTESAWVEIPEGLPEALLPADVALLKDPYNRERLRRHGLFN